MTKPIEILFLCFILVIMMMMVNYYVAVGFILTSFVEGDAACNVRWWVDYELTWTNQSRTVCSRFQSCLCELLQMWVSECVCVCACMCVSVSVCVCVWPAPPSLYTWNACKNDLTWLDANSEATTIDHHLESKWLQQKAQRYKCAYRSLLVYMWYHIVEIYASYFF